MKKIIELAERYLDTEELKAKIRTDYDNEEWHFQMSEIYNKLRSAIEDRKRLSETPITEDWLKEHGWKKNEMVFNAWSKTSEVGIREFATLILVNGYNRGWYVCDTPIRVNTIAQLLDALDLCGIKID